MLLEKSHKIVFIGDSITDCEREHPVGEGLRDALGKGYVALVQALLETTYTEYGIRVVNMGISGNTVRDLKNRWDTDVIALKPDWVSVMIGINDVWKQYHSPMIKEQHVYPDEYERTLGELVESTRPLVKGLVLMTPYYIENNTSDAMRSMMDKYGLMVKKIAEQNDCVFVDLQAAFNQVLAFLYPATLAWDRVHPTATGHMIIAKAFLNRIGFDWNHTA